MTVERKARPYLAPHKPLGYKRVISDGLYAYFVDERKESTVHAIAEKAVKSGLVSNILRPLREYRLDHLVSTVETPTLYDRKDSKGKGEEIVAIPLRGEELAHAIVEAQIPNEGE